MFWFTYCLISFPWPDISGVCNTGIGCDSSCWHHNLCSSCICSPDPCAWISWRSPCIPRSWPLHSVCQRLCLRTPHTGHIQHCHHSSPCHVSLWNTVPGQYTAMLSSPAPLCMCLCEMWAQHPTGRILIQYPDRAASDTVVLTCLLRGYTPPATLPPHQTHNWQLGCVTCLHHHT